jgi:N-acyl-D-aspartate/D-glutamate deacylase
MNLKSQLKQVNMRAREFIVEQKLDDVHDALDIADKSLPHTYVIPSLQNNDFYELYRFGVAIAAVRGESGAKDGVHDGNEPEFRAASSWGEHQIVSSMDPEVGELIDKALHKIGKSGKKSVSTPGSDEMDDTLTQSPLRAFKGYKR